MIVNQEISFSSADSQLWSNTRPQKKGECIPEKEKNVSSKNSSSFSSLTKLNDDYMYYSLLHVLTANIVLWS